MIQKLSQKVINQIAAGEVVERPASVVKELMENSLDAKASRIIVKVLDGGREEIFIEDDGVGISYKDIPKVFEPNSTSKLVDIDDLNHISTMGFRGEALASISAVCQVVLETKYLQDETGYRLIKEGQKVSDIQKIVLAQNGTRLKISKIFFNVPARRKFLKGRATELSHIISVVQNIALINPDKHIQFYSDNKLIYDYPPLTIKDRFAQIFNITKKEYIFELEYLGRNIQVEGIITHPILSKKSNHSKVFVNERPINSSLIQKAVQTGYDTMLEVGHYPLFMVNIKLPANEVDINVHPRKTEVKFVDEKSIFSQIKFAIKESLTKKAFSPKITPDNSFNSSKSNFIQPKSKIPDEIYFNTISYKDKKINSNNNSVKLELKSNIIKETKDIYQNPFRKQVAQNTQVVEYAQTSFKESLTPLKENYDINYIHIFDTYIVYKNQDGLIILDQHAVHEKILLEQMLNKPDEIKSQNLFLPIEIQVMDTDKDLVLSNLNGLIGIVAEDFGLGSIIIRSVPVFLNKYSKVELVLKDIIDQIVEAKGAVDMANLKNNLYKTIACKSAIKAGYKISKEEILELIKQAQETPSSFSCCHGRPTMFQLDQNWFEKMFSRK